MKLISTTLAGPGTGDIIGDALRSVGGVADARAIVFTMPHEQNPLTIGPVTWLAASDLISWWPWRDHFGEARNAALNAVSGAADWALMLDTDERVICPDPASFRAFLEAQPPHIEIVIVNAADGSHGRERIFRLPAKHRWYGRTHETFPHGERVVAPSSLISWTELPKSPERLRERAERDLVLLSEEIAEHPAEPRWRTYRGHALQTLGRDEDAIEEYRASASLGHGEDSVNACYAAALLCLKMRRYDEAIAACARGLALNCTFGELAWAAGVAALHLGHPDQAIGWARLAMVHGASGEGKDALAVRVGHRATYPLGNGPADLLRAAQAMCGPSTRAIVFSKDRPLQLDACLRSMRLHCQDLAALSVHVLCYASTEAFGAAYRELIDATPWVTFHAQRDFEEDVRMLIAGSEHVLFVVDDTIFARDFNVLDLVRALDAEDDAIGFSLRLGGNTTYCYPFDRAQEVPEMEPAAHGALGFQWRTADGDFGYPLELSSSLYRSREILYCRGAWTNPNTMEASLASWAPGSSCARLLCAPLSLAFSMPLNRVQETHANRASEQPALSAEALLEVWQRGGHVDVDRYVDYTPRACHEEATLFLEERAAVEIVEQPIYLTVTSTAVRAAAWAPRCIESVLRQTITGAHIYFAADEETTDAARPWVADLRNGSGKGLLENLLPVWRSLPDDEVIVWLDGDDWLATDHALATVAEAHRRGALATYGSFIYADGRPGFAAPGDADPRTGAWRYTHLKTFRAKLAKAIRDEDLRRPDGAYVDLAIDQAVMLPIVEMAGPRAVFIPQFLCVYNHAHSFEGNASEEQLARERAEVRRIRSLPRYQRRF